MATFKHISSKNADYGAAEAYLTFEHDEFTMKPTLDENGRLIPREDYRISSLNCGGEDFAVACIRPPEIEIELEKEIKIEKEREGETGHPAPAAYGRYNNVILTDTELSGLKTELPDKWEYYIDRLSCHIASTGKQYHSHAATIYKWAQEDAAKGKAAPKQGIPDYSCKEGESL